MVVASLRIASCSIALVENLSISRSRSVGFCGSWAVLRLLLLAAGGGLVAEGWEPLAWVGDGGGSSFRR